MTRFKFLLSLVGMGGAAKAAPSFSDDYLEQRCKDRRIALAKVISAFREKLNIPDVTKDCWAYENGQFPTNILVSDEDIEILKGKYRGQRVTGLAILKNGQVLGSHTFSHPSDRAYFCILHSFGKYVDPISVWVTIPPGMTLEEAVDNPDNIKVAVEFDGDFVLT